MRASGKPTGEAEGEHKRRKDDRPGEIIAAAAECFLRNGFARTHLEDGASAAGTAKGNIFRYLSGKEDLFRAVAHAVMTEDLAVIDAAATADATFVVQLPALLNNLADCSGQSRIPVFSRLVTEERGFFPNSPPHGTRTSPAGR